MAIRIAAEVAKLQCLTEAQEPLVLADHQLVLRLMVVEALRPLPRVLNPWVRLLGVLQEQLMLWSYSN